MKESLGRTDAGDSGRKMATGELNGEWCSKSTNKSRYNILHWTALPEQMGNFPVHITAWHVEQRARLAQKWYARI
jgi:hypothetical protein